MKTDEQIAYTVKCGQREGQDQLVSRYGQEVFTMISRMVPVVMDAEELAQDTFLRAFRNIGSYDPKQASLSTWLCRIAYRLTLNFLKRSRPYLISIEETEVWQTDLSDEQLETEFYTGREERIQILEKMMDELPPDERLLLTLYYFENRSLKECSFIMDASLNALANRLLRIRKKLYKQIIRYDHA